jgi:hypothetical protein
MKNEEEEEEGPKREDKAPPPVVSIDKKLVWHKLDAYKAGLAQLLTAAIGMGWLWSVSHGCVFISNAMIY